MFLDTANGENDRNYPLFQHPHGVWKNGLEALSAVNSMKEKLPNEKIIDRDDALNESYTERYADFNKRSKTRVASVKHRKPNELYQG